MKQKTDQTACIRAALRWTDPAPPPDVQTPDTFGELSRGYVFNAYARRIDVACSSSASHAIGQTDRTTRSWPLALYSTRLRALQALRNAMEQEYAQQLCAIDLLIEQAS